MLNTIHSSSFYCDIIVALKTAHGMGIAHNDIRAPNIVVNEIEKVATLIDWGKASFNNKALSVSFEKDVVDLIKLYITNKLFHGFSIDQRFESLPNFVKPLVVAAKNCAYDTLVELISSSTSVSTTTTSTLFEKLTIE